MVQMAASSKIIFYFCNVKTQERYEAAANKQRFLCSIILLNIAVWSGVSVTTPRFSALEYLTAPTAFLLFKNQEL